MKKTILLTGATDGIGLETAKQLASEGHVLLLHGRSEEKLERVKTDLLVLYPNAKIDSFAADFASLEDVHRMVKNIKLAHSRIDVIINNAGIFITDSTRTKDGFDVRFCVNTIAPYIITKGLWSLLDGTSRIINLSSAAQAPFDLSVIKQGAPLSHDQAYAMSKLALTMWTMKLAEMHPNGPMLVAVNPKSFLGSKMVKQAYGREGYDLRIGADILVRASLSDEFQNASGKYFDNDRGTFAKAHPFAYDEAAQDELVRWLDSL